MGKNDNTNAPELDKRIQDLESSNAAKDNEIADLKKALADKDGEISDLKGQLDLAQGIIKDQADQMATAGTGTTGVYESPTGTSKSGKEVRFLRRKFRIIGDPTLHLSETASQDPELIEKILAINGQTIVQVIQ